MGKSNGDERGKERRRAPSRLLPGLGEWRLWPKALEEIFKDMERDGLPTKPYLGRTAQEMAVFLVDVARRSITAAQDLNSKGKGIEVKLHNEYDFQNLFFLSTKPWLPTLGREEVTVWFDGQKKTADFNLANSQIIIELKHVADSNSKAQVVKTLSGLSEFYKRNANVRILLMGILVNKDVELEDARWEAEFSKTYESVIVKTFVIRNTGAK